jgi:D-alanine-D-alanine ligase
MYKINNIAVLYGGSSSEREISLESGNRVHKSILELGYESCLIDFNDLESLDKLINYDYVFIALHGFEGEGGKLQDNLDKLNIRYSGSGPNACSNTWNKKLTKEILYKNDIRTPKWLGVTFGTEVVQKGLNASSFDKFRPFNHLFIKPQEDGSSIDIFKISDNESLQDAYQKCVKPDRDFLFEEYINGREITVTIINQKCFPPIEILTNNDFYDYDAKYISNDTLHVEAKLSNKELKQIESISLNAFEVLDCKGWGRVDLLQDEMGNFNVIEINTVPGMTAHSNVPKSGSLLGLSYSDVVQEIINASF